MSILTDDFLFFAAVLLAAYYVLPVKLRSAVLLFGSAFFALQAGYGGAAYLGAVILITWLGALGLSALRRGKRLLLAALLVLILGAMCAVKYRTELSILGLSYFSFQSAGYLIDVSRAKAPAQKNPFKVCLFIGYFPQLVQGPIASFEELGERVNAGHRLDPVQAVSGFTLLLWGYFKKMVLADRLSPTTAALLKEDAALPGWQILLFVVLYTVRLYADFSGGMDVVRGLSRMFGVELPENFRRPFFSKSVAEYWRRWHISLGKWFRSYLLYPFTTSKAGLSLGRLAGKALGKKTGRLVPTALATLAVFLLIGIWHGLSWTAFAYGLYFGVLMAASVLLEPAFKKLRKRLRKPNGIGMQAFRLARTWLLILPAQYFAFTASMGTSVGLLTGTFSNWSLAGAAEAMTGVMELQEWVLAAAAALILLLVDLLCEKWPDLCERLAAARIWVRWPILLALILSIMIFGVYGTDIDSSAFLYTRF